MTMADGDRRETAGEPRFRTVILDVDSTLSAIEGIDWLARNRGGDVAARIAAVTERAMNGEIPLDAVYGERLAVVRPSAEELDALGQAYVDALSLGARAAVTAMRNAGVRVVIVSGGILHPILRLARELGVRKDDVHAVRVDLTDAGAYAGWDTASPLARDLGKLDVVRSLALPRPVLAVGDGVTDSEMKPAVDAYACYTEYVRREKAAAVADVELRSFDEVLRHVLP